MYFVEISSKLLTLALGQGKTRNLAQYHLHRMPYAPANFVAAEPMVKEKMHLQEIINLTQGQGQLKQCPLYDETYVPAKF